jgi:hypothetical protein
MSTNSRRPPSRACKACGAPCDKRALCSRCSPRRPTSDHRDKYADKKKESKES